MLPKEAADFVSQTVLNMAEGPTPTAMEILIALNRVAEEAHRIGLEEGARQGYARGVAAGSKHTATVFDRIMSAP